MAKPSGDNMISISLEYINASLALGCLLILQDTFTDEDSFLILKRHGSNQTMSETVVVSAGNYHAYLYDLEDTLHPNPYPANVSLQVLKVNGSCECMIYSPYTTTISIPIRFSYHTDLQPEIPSNPENLAIVQNGSNVIIHCERKVAKTSYILLYRVYSDLTLNVLNISIFPVAISLEIGNYTIAIFRVTVIAGMDDIEESPFLRKRIQVIGTVSSDSKMAIPTSILSGNYYYSAHLSLIILSHHHHV